MNAITKHHNAPPLAERLDLDHASLAQQAADALAAESLPPIMVDEDLETYSERAKALKGVAAMVEKARKSEKDQILKDGRTVDDFFAKLAKPVKDAADAVVGKINDWQRKKLEEQRKREREEAEAARAAATPFDEPAPVVAPVSVKEAARVVSSTTGKVAAVASTVWRHELIDAQAVPRQFLSVDETKIKMAIAGGVRDIPGVRIFEDVRTAIR